MLAPITAVLAFLSNPTLPTKLARRFNRVDGQAGQSTAEYALVVLAAAAIAVMLLTWVTKSGAIGGLFGALFKSVLSHIL